LTRKAYPFLFFDLDHTLWDYDQNAADTLLEAYDVLHLYRFDIQPQQLISDFLRSNSDYWKLFNQNKITKEELRFGRFSEILMEKCSQEKILELSLYFTVHCPQKSALYPEASEVLHKLKDQGHKMHIISNGFEQAQQTKLKSSGIDHLFETVHTSESSGFRKPDPQFFRFALLNANANPLESLMIGDNPETDISGGRSASLDTVWFAPAALSNTCQATFHIRKLTELTEIV
jgi:putative hydrolase of the HAD superfamily